MNVEKICYEVDKLKFSLSLPSDFADYELEVRAKGWFSEAKLSVSGKLYRLTFYDRARLNQDIQSELENNRVFFEPNLVIVESVTKLEMERACYQLVQSDQIRMLIPE